MNCCHRWISLRNNIFKKIKFMYFVCIKLNPIPRIFHLHNKINHPVLCLWCGKWFHPDRSNFSISAHRIWCDNTLCTIHTDSRRFPEHHSVTVLGRISELYHISDWRSPVLLFEEHCSTIWLATLIMKYMNYEIRSTYLLRTAWLIFSILI